MRWSPRRPRDPPRSHPEFRRYSISARPPRPLARNDADTSSDFFSTTFGENGIVESRAAPDAAPRADQRPLHASEGNDCYEKEAAKLAQRSGGLALVANTDLTDYDLSGMRMV